jgi:hypothetical protein
MSANSAVFGTAALPIRLALHNFVLLCRYLYPAFPVTTNTDRSAGTRTQSIGFGDRDVIRLHHAPITRYTYPEGRHLTALRHDSHNSFTDYRRPIRPLRVSIRAQIAQIIGATKAKERATLQHLLERPAQP